MMKKLAFIACLIPLLLTGCAWMKLNRNTELSAFGPKAPCRVPPHANAEDLVRHLNENVGKLNGWTARHVKLKANNIPLNALIAVEKGKHLRIMVSSMVGDEMDIGSNDEVFWFWAKRHPQPAVMYASHDQIDLVRESLQIPFEPAWLMEGLGVAEIPLEGVTLTPGDGRTSVLASNHVLGNGQHIRKAITVDHCHGRVLEHSIWDANHNRIAHSTFSKHRLDPETGVILPQQIRIEWPKAEVSLVMDLGPVEINPNGLPEKIWDLPQMPGYQQVNLETVVAQQGRRRPRPPVVVSQQSSPPQKSSDDLWKVHRETAADEPENFDDEEMYDVEPE